MPPKKSNTDDKKLKETAQKQKKEEEQEGTPDDQQVEQAQKILASLGIDKQKAKYDEAASKSHPFWDHQPVPKLSELVADEGSAIDKIKTVDEVQQSPYRLPDGFEWSETDVDDEKTIIEIYNLLTENYVEDDDAMFRFDYSVPFLRWALKPPGYYKSWHIGVRVSKNQKLVGFITGVPSHIKVYGKVIMMTEINFLCVHKKLREKRLAPVLIMEITRRVNLQNIWQAVYTAGRVLPKPVASCRYYHRSLNPKKLIEVGFSHLAPRMTVARTMKLYKLPDEPQLKGIRPLQPKDVPSATKLLNNYLDRFNLKSVFSEAEFAHWFTPLEGIMNSFVITDTNGQVTDLVSFYTLPSSILNNPNYKLLKAAYSYYNVATTVQMVDLVRDALIFAKKLNFDVYNCLDIMENSKFINELKFGKGDGNLQYYLYNWRCKSMEPENIGLVLL